jgi:hypothetical protein
MVRHQRQLDKGSSTNVMVGACDLQGGQHDKPVGAGHEFNYTVTVVNTAR